MFDAIVVGARCGGSPTAMLLARHGYRVLLVDQATFPSDTVSTHFIWPPGLACLKRWGLLERVLASNSPTFRTIGLDLGDYVLTGDMPPTDGVAEMSAPRRTVLDKLLRDAASGAGTEVREATTVTGLIFADHRVTGIRCRGRSGTEFTEYARIVIGADGRHSLVAKHAGAAEYNVRPVMTCALYAYWRDVAPHLVAIHPLPQRVVVNFPTNDGLTITPVLLPRDQLPQILANPEEHLVAALRMVPSLAEPFSGASRVERIRIMGDIPNFFRKPHGDGWALVGDAGYHKDPILAQGISDAFCSAQRLADAIHAGFSGAEPLDDALDMYARQRDAHFQPMYDLTCNMAKLEPPPPEIVTLYNALRENAVERNRYFGTLGGTVSIPEYYAPEHLQYIVSGAAAEANRSNAIS
jgi:2-polyprenyl-6-methoxyphenol hydroxylase-like FAD-dependent oxidoreductase